MENASTAAKKGQCTHHPFAQLAHYLRHNKAECTKPRVFKGECRICKQSGHPAAECPEKPVEKCFNCKEEGHVAIDCKKKRVLDYAGIEELTAQEAWNKLVDADAACELDDVRMVRLLSTSHTRQYY